jgi:hypothetical protein
MVLSKKPNRERNRVETESQKEAAKGSNFFLRNALTEPIFSNRN